MGSCKQQWLSWIIILISAAAACVSCQQQGITSTLGEGNRTCPGEEVTFTCTLRGSLALAWSSPGYIADDNPLQFSTASMLRVDVPSMINGRTTATARLTTNTIDNGEQLLQSTLRITATVASTVICSNISGDIGSIEFSISAVPGVPQMISAVEVSQPRDSICIILVTWNPPANSTSDIDQYIIYVPSRNIRDISSSTISTLAVPNCDDDVRIQVAAANRFGCVGLYSSEVRLTLLDIPTVPTDEGATTTEDGSAASTSNQLSISAVAGIIGGAVVLIILMIVLVPATVLYRKDKKFKCKLDKERFGSSLGSLYDALKQNNIPLIQEAVRHLLNLEKKVSSSDVKDALMVVFEVKVTSATGIQFALRRLNRMIPKVMSTLDDELKNVGSTVTMGQLSGAAEKEDQVKGLDTLENLNKAVKHATPQKKKKESALDTLKKQVVLYASPEKAKDLLHQLFQALQDYLKAEAENLKAEPEKDEIHEVFVALGGKLREAPPERVKTQLQKFIGMLQGNVTNESPDGASSPSKDLEESDDKQPRVSPTQDTSGPPSGRKQQQDDGLSSGDSTDGPLPRDPISGRRVIAFRQPVSRDTSGPPSGCKQQQGAKVAPLSRRFPGEAAAATVRNTEV